MPRHPAALPTQPLALLVVAAFALSVAPGAAAQNLQLTLGEGLAQTDDFFGISIAALGDVDGDGSDDLVIGAPGVGDSGAAFVVNGRTGQVLFTVTGDAPGDSCGRAVANAGDVNLDGVDDVLVGIPGSNFNGNDTGRVRVYSGATGVVLITRIGPASQSYFGEAVAGVGDLNGDGRSEFLVGAPSYEPGPDLLDNDYGYASLHDGLFGGVLETWVGADASDRLGTAVAGLGDLDGDGRPDFAIGTPGRDLVLPGLTLQTVGRIQVYSGASQALLWTRHGNSMQALGYSIDGCGDVNGNGVPEVLVGAPGDGGRALLCDGLSGSLLHTFTGLSLSADDRFGAAVACLGDLDRDGVDDVAVGAPGTWTGSPIAGYVRAFSGATFAPYAPAITGAAAGDVFGLSLAGDADLNGDAWPDLAVGILRSDVAAVDAGLVQVFNYLSFQTDLGFGGPGSATLAMYGTPLATGGQADLRLSFATPSSLAWLVASVGNQPLPFKGGLLVPMFSTALVFPLATNASGGFVIPGIPGGSGPVFVFLQALIKAPVQPLGWELSNALQVELLP